MLWQSSVDRNIPGHGANSTNPSSIFRQNIFYLIASEQKAYIETKCDTDDVTIQLQHFLHILRLNLVTDTGQCFVKHFTDKNTYSLITD